MTQVTRSSSPGCHGVLVLDKPKGLTSHDVVARVRRTLRLRQVGHAGTLDPMATGVLVVALGEATKLVPWLTAADKSYDATVTLGAATDTLDADGQILERAPLPAWLAAALARPARGPEMREVESPLPELEDALDRERARTSQVPPAYSAIHTGGERAFAKARRGEAVDLAPREVHVRRLAVTQWTAEPPAIDLAVDAAKGYYVRALARDLAEGLGTLGHLSRLRRVRSGGFAVADAVALDAADLRSRVISLASAAVRALPAATLTDSGVDDARHGRSVRPEHLRSGDAPVQAPGTYAWLDERGELVAIGRVGDDGRGAVVRGFAAGS